MLWHCWLGGIGRVKKLIPAITKVPWKSYRDQEYSVENRPLKQAMEGLWIWNLKFPGQENRGKRASVLKKLENYWKWNTVVLQFCREKSKVRALKQQVKVHFFLWVCSRCLTSFGVINAVATIGVCVVINSLSLTMLQNCYTCKYYHGKVLQNALFESVGIWYFQPWKILEYSNKISL